MLILLPCACTLTQSAWQALIQKVEKGAVALVTGPVDYDEYWKRLDRLPAVAIPTAIKTEPVSHEEFITIDSRIFIEGIKLTTAPAKYCSVHSTGQLEMNDVVDLSSF